MTNLDHRLRLTRSSRFLALAAFVTLIPGNVLAGGPAVLDPSQPTFEWKLQTAKVIGAKNGRLYGVAYDPNQGVVRGADNFMTSDDLGENWSNVRPAALSSSEVTQDGSSLLQLVFMCNMQFAITTSGKIWRNAEDVWAGWTDVSVPGLPTGTTARPDVLAGNGLYLFYGNYNADSSIPGAGAHVYRSGNCGTSWTEVMVASQGRHVHAIANDPSDISSIWVSIGDASSLYSDSGLWHSSDHGSPGSFTQVSSNRYGIGFAFPPGSPNGPSWVLLEGDGPSPNGKFTPPSIIGFDKASLSATPVGSTAEGLIWPDTTPTSVQVQGCDSYWGGSSGAMKITAEGNLFWATTGEGEPCLKTGVWLAQGPSFTSWVLLKDMTNEVTGWELYKTYEVGNYLFNNIYRITKQKFVGQ